MTVSFNTLSCIRSLSHNAKFMLFKNNNTKYMNIMSHSFATTPASEKPSRDGPSPTATGFRSNFKFNPTYIFASCLFTIFGVCNIPLSNFSYASF
jgi:hypothetical protein